MATSLRGRLLRALLPPVAALLTLGAVAEYFLALEPASEAYDQALVDVGIALSERIRSSGEDVTFDLPGAVEKVLRTDKFDSIYYHVRRPDGTRLATSSADGTVRVWRSDGTLITVITGFAQGARCVAWSPDGRTLATGDGVGTLRLWRLD